MQPASNPQPSGPFDPARTTVDLTAGRSDLAPSDLAPSDLARGDRTNGDAPPIDRQTETWDTTNLLSFHGTLGRPVKPSVPLEPLKSLSWNAQYQIERLLGRGAQGVVYLANRQGVDGYSTKVAVKVFYRNPELALDEYIAEMQRIAVQAQHVSGIQHDNLVNVRDFVALEQTRVMVLEWIDGLDLGKLLDPRLLGHLKERLEKRDWDRLNDVIMTKGDDHSRLRPGVAVDILHDCLGGLSALHKNGIAHCDLKPSNIMVKRTGTKKIIDIDSSCVVNEGQHLLRGTPYYMSPEQLRRKPLELYSDIATLGYVLIEMLTGRLLFRDCKTIDDLLQAKLSLPERLAEFLPAEIGEDTLLTGMVQKMVAVDPTDRFPNADEADLDPLGAISFTRKLVREDLATEYDRELAWLLDSVGNIDFLI